MTIFETKRVYEPATGSDGQRVLVDRIWPRGLRKSDVRNAVWLKDVAPSTELRKWFGHKPARWNEFRRRYRAELKANAAVDALINLSRNRSRITLLYSARDQKHNQALVLAAYLKRMTRRAGVKR